MTDEKRMEDRDSVSDVDGFDDETIEESKDRESEQNELEDGDQLFGAQPGQKLQAKWEEMYRRLLLFKEKHGHCCKY